MPTYIFKNNETDEVYEVFMGISERDQFIIDNPGVTQLPPNSLTVVDPVRLGRMKPSDSFRDIIRNIKKEHHGSKVNTW